MTPLQRIKTLEPAWELTPNGDCVMTWGAASLSLNFDGEIILKNQHAEIRLLKEGQIHLNTRESR